MFDYLTHVLRERREAAGITLAQMERVAGLDRGNLSRLERGLARAVRDLDGIVEGYAKALGVQPVDLWEEALELWKADIKRRPSRRRKSPS